MSREHTVHSVSLLEFSITLPQPGQSGRGGRAPHNARSPAAGPPLERSCPVPRSPARLLVKHSQPTLLASPWIPLI